MLVYNLAKASPKGLGRRRGSTGARLSEQPSAEQDLARRLARPSMPHFGLELCVLSWLLARMRLQPKTLWSAWHRLGHEELLLE